MRPFCRPPVAVMLIALFASVATPAVAQQPLSPAELQSFRLFHKLFRHVELLKKDLRSEDGQRRTDGV